MCDVFFLSQFITHLSGPIVLFCFVFVAVPHHIQDPSSLWELGIKPESLLWKQGVLTSGLPGEVLLRSILNSALLLLLLLLSRFSRVRLCATPWTAAHQAPPVPGILQARTLEWVAISSSNAWKWKVKVKSLSRIRPSMTPWTAAYQAPPSMGFSRRVLEWGEHTF